MWGNIGCVSSTSGYKEVRHLQPLSVLQSAIYFILSICIRCSQEIMTWRLSITANKPT